MYILNSYLIVKFFILTITGYVYSSIDNYRNGLKLQHWRLILNRMLTRNKLFNVTHSNKAATAASTKPITLLSRNLRGNSLKKISIEYNQTKLYSAIFEKRNT